MHVKLYNDNKLDLDLDGIAQGLNRIVTNIIFSTGNNLFSPPTSVIKYPDTYRLLPREFKNEAQNFDFTICSTKTPYENNYFFEYSDNIVILSFYAWEQLTSLPQNNGLVYFIASFLSDNLKLGDAHNNTTGCVNDFLWDKTAIDVGMRSGFICSVCKRNFENSNPTNEDRELLNNIEIILRDLSLASRQRLDIVQYWRSKNVDDSFVDNFDVFLCYNSQDKEEVRNIDRQLKDLGVRTWLDEEQLRPGFAWQVALEEQIGAIKSAAVFVGASGIGPWHNMEMRAFLSEFVSRRCPVIPVILPGAGTVPELPIFLRQLTWVDFRRNQSDAMNRLIWGVTGNRPI